MPDDFPTEEEAKDLGAAFAAMAEQAVAASGQVAKMMFGYYKELIDSGFSDDQAMILTVSYQQEFMRASQGGE